MLNSMIILFIRIFCEKDICASLIFCKMLYPVRYLILKYTGTLIKVASLYAEIFHLHNGLAERRATSNLKKLT